MKDFTTNIKKQSIKEIKERKIEEVFNTEPIKTPPRKPIRNHSENVQLNRTQTYTNTKNFHKLKSVTIKNQDLEDKMISFNPSKRLDRVDDEELRRRPETQSNNCMSNINKKSEEKHKTSHKKEIAINGIGKGKDKNNNINSIPIIQTTRHIKSNSQREHRNLNPGSEVFITENFHIKPKIDLSSKKNVTLALKQKENFKGKELTEKTKR